jgi:hypothetical protein
MCVSPLDSTVGTLRPGKAKVTFDLSRLRSRLRLHLNAETGADGLLIQPIGRVLSMSKIYPVSAERHLFHGLSPEANEALTVSLTFVR